MTSLSDRCSVCGKLKEIEEVFYGPEWLFTRKISRCECREDIKISNLKSLDEAIAKLDEQLKLYRNERRKLLVAKRKEK